MCAEKKVSAIQATPKTAKIAVIPALNTDPLLTSAGFTLQKIRMKAPATSIAIWMTRFIDRAEVLPSTSKVGRKFSNAPRATTVAMPAKKIQVDRNASLGNVLPIKVALLPPPA